MKWRDWLELWGIPSLELAPKNPDRKAAWELCVEPLTRVTTQDLTPDKGDENSALDSVFKLIRQSLKAQHGYEEFAKLSVGVVLSQLNSFFTAAWNKLLRARAFAGLPRCQDFCTKSPLSGKSCTKTKGPSET